APAEQSVYEQIDEALDASRRGQMTELTIQAPQWFQNLILRPEDLASFCAPLVRKTMQAVRAVRSALGQEGALSMILLSDSAGRLPGLTAALEAEVEEAMADQSDSDDEDFGEGLMEEAVVWPAGVHVLGPDAAAWAALELAARALRGDLPCGH